MKRTINKLELLAALPARLDGVELEAAGDGRWHLKVPMRPTKWARLILRLPPQATRTFELDALGKTFWDACDGKTPLGQITSKLAVEHKLNADETERRTIAFVNTLVKKGLIALAMEDDEHSASTSDRVADEQEGK